MEKGMIQLNDHSITLDAGNGVVVSKAQHELLTLYCLVVGSDALANDSTCFLFQYEDQIWLVPEMTPGVRQIQEWSGYFKKAKNCVVAQADYLPFKWKKKYLLFFGVEAQLLILDSSEFSKIEDQLKILPDKYLEDIL